MSPWGYMEKHTTALISHQRPSGLSCQGSSVGLWLLLCFVLRSATACPDGGDNSRVCSDTTTVSVTTRTLTTRATTDATFGLNCHKFTIRTSKISHRPHWPGERTEIHGALKHVTRLHTPHVLGHGVMLSP
jgi:hypothetical protein